MHVLVVGASVAGVAAADGLRTEGFGGVITVVDAEPGLPYDKPPLSKQALAPEWEPGKALLRPEQHYRDRSIDLVSGRRATSLDAATTSVRLDDGSAVSADAIVLAPGVRPRRLPDASMLAGVHAIRSAADSAAVRSALLTGPRVVVVGCGFIGAETAAVAARMGLDVTVVEMLDPPFGPLFGDDVGRAMARWHSESGVRLETGVGVAGVEGNGKVDRVVLSDGRTVAADLVVLGLGATPAVDWLAGSGIEIGDGIVCDAYGRTSAPGVWACGDAAAWPDPVTGIPTRIEHWTTAKEHGAAVAHNIAHPRSPGRTAGAVPYFWSDQYGRRLQFLGTSAGHDSMHVVHGGLDSREFVALYGRRGTLVGALGVAAARQLMQYRPAIARRADIGEVLPQNTTCVGVRP